MKKFWSSIFLCIILLPVISGCGNIETQISVIDDLASSTPSPQIITPVVSQTSLPSHMPPVSSENPAPAASETGEPLSFFSNEYFAPQLISCNQDECIYSVFQPLLRPIPNEFKPKVEKTYRYGSTQNGSRESHAGVEFPADSGTPVIASANGIVFYAGDDRTNLFGPVKNFYGNLVILEHHWGNPDQTIYTVYAHLSKIIVKTGDKVIKGQEIGEVGSTGTASGSHLHYEVRVNGTGYGNTVNPELWLTPANEGSDDSQTCGTLIARFHLDKDTVYSVTALIENFTDPQAERKPYIDAESYARGAPRDIFWNENLVIGDLPPGDYRISLVRKNHVYQKFIQVETNRITLVEFEFMN